MQTLLPLHSFFTRNPEFPILHSKPSACQSQKWVGTLSKELLESRRRDLEAYIKGLVSQGALVWKCDSLRAFLELPPRPDGTRGSGGKQLVGNGGKGKGDSFDSDADDMLRL